MKETEIEAIVATFGGRQFLRCYRDLTVAIELEMMYLTNDPQMKLICAEICHRWEGRSLSAVAKSLSRAVEDLWYYGNKEILNEYFQDWKNSKPTPHEFIYAVARQLKLKDVANV